MSLKNPISAISKKLPELFLLSTLLTFPIQVFADKGMPQMHVRTGLVKGTYDGVIDGEISEVTSLDLEIENIRSSKWSYYARTTLLFDAADTVFLYRYLGGGMKWYLSSSGMKFDTKSKFSNVAIYPKWRFYLGWEVGISSIVLKRLGEFLQITTSAYDYGGSGGVIYNLTESVGIEFNATAQFSTGFTTVSTGGVTMKALLGLAIYL